MFTEALFTIAKTCKQCKCPSTEDWLKKCGVKIEINSQDFCSHPVFKTLRFHGRGLVFDPWSGN